MDSLADISVLEVWLLNWGSWALFFLLVLGILALPIPEETLLVVSGVLMHHGKLTLSHTACAALLGSMCGITSSYLFGRTAGIFLIHRYGKWLGINQKMLDRAHQWFERFGKWSLFFGYFVPGIRHFTGFFAGMTTLSFREFTLFAYTGALVWVTTFLSIGYFFGSYWFSVIKELEVKLDDAVTLCIFLCLAYLVYLAKKHAKQHSSSDIS